MSEVHPPVAKAVAYITRLHAGRLQLLVFEHVDHPEAGVQVPAGGIEPGEGLEIGLQREAAEECGLTDLLVAGKLGELAQPEFNHVRHVYHVLARDATPDRWIHQYSGGGADDGLRFACYFADVPDLPPLAADLGRWLPELLAATN